MPGVRCDAMEAVRHDDLQRSAGVQAALLFAAYRALDSGQVREVAGQQGSLADVFRQPHRLDCAVERMGPATAAKVNVRLHGERKRQRAQRSRLPCLIDYRDESALSVFEALDAGPGAGG